MSATETKTLTHQEYLQAMGLGVLIRETYARLTALERALGELFHEPSDNGYYGWISDEVYTPTGPDIDSLVSKLEFTVEPAGQS